MVRTSRSQILKWSLLVLGPLVCLGLASAQYYGGAYPYAKPTVPKAPTSLPRSAQTFNGFSGNPYARSTVPPTGMPIGTTHNYFGSGVGNPVASRPQPKPFSSVKVPGPLVTSRQAAQIEVAKGLWDGYGMYGY
ncbi:hypothetical protein [Aeoliella mucimassa]|uniref:Uncharacterized protein n=1 Tax=Aeoliella mucimassa TaxID=2527972 RepID=A0A518AJK2_9BACT|nr:hypothetical protein [Aeoliella mucimassa]QDU54917.1 hypothetical protein Pan181_11020 [Aeoliella mucimassa]